MTENNTKKNLELLERCYRVSKKGSALHEVLIEFVTLEDLVEAIQALEEVQQYRAIGTVEECRDNKDFLEFLYNHIQPNEMEQYLSMYHTKDKVAVNGYADQCGLMPAT